MTFTAERPPILETDPVTTGVEMNLGQLSVQQELIRRGDHQLPDEPNRGFRIEHLEAYPRQPVPVEQALPWSEDFRAKDFAQQYIDGTTPIEIVGEALDGVKGLGFVVYFPVRASRYQEAIVAGEVKADLFGIQGKVSHIEPGAEALDALIDPEQKRERLEAYYRQQAKTIQKNYVNDLEGITDRGDLPDLREAYELLDGDRSIRLLNFSSTLIGDEQLRQAVNAVRAASDKGGGELFDRLRTITVLPEGHPTLSHKVRDEEGEFDLPFSGEARGTSLYISGRVIQPVEDRKPVPERIKKYWRKYFDQYRLPAEPTEGPGSPKDTAANFDWETLLAHELEHIALPANKVELPGPGPTLYSRVNKREQEAELGAIEHMGGEDALAISEDQRRAKQEMWQQRRGSDDGLIYRQPQGPRFVVCRELDLTKGALPVRLRYPGRPLPTEVTYRLVPDA